MSSSETSHVWGVVQEWLDAQPFPPSQAKLADRLGVSKSLVSDWKFGKHSPKPDELKALAVLCGVPLERMNDALLKDLGLRPGSDSANAV